MPMDCSKKVLEMDHLLLHCHWLILTNTKTHFTPCTTVVTSTVDCQTPSPVVDRSLRCPSSIISHEFHLSYLFELLWKVVANTWINQAVPPQPPSIPPSNPPRGIPPFEVVRPDTNPDLFFTAFGCRSSVLRQRSHSQRLKDLLSSHRWWQKWEFLSFFFFFSIPPTVTLNTFRKCKVRFFSLLMSFRRFVLLWGHNWYAGKNKGFDT